MITLELTPLFPPTLTFLLSPLSPFPESSSRMASHSAVHSSLWSVGSHCSHHWLCTKELLWPQLAVAFSCGHKNRQSEDHIMSISKQPQEPPPCGSMTSPTTDFWAGLQRQTWILFYGVRLKSDFATHFLIQSSGNGYFGCFLFFGYCQW